MTALHKPGDDLKTVLAGLVLLWVCFVIQVAIYVVRGVNLIDSFGVLPHEPWGLIGIVTAPLLHAGWGHLIANSIALLILGYLARRTAPEGSGVAILLAMLCGGLLAWTTGTPHQPHIGASGLAFGLIGFLLVNGLVRGGCGPLLVTVAVGLLFGGAIFTVLQPEADNGAKLSWQMHVGGLIGGITAAWITRRRRVD